MKIYISINAENIIQSWAKTRSTDTEIEVEVVDNHLIFSTPFKFLKYINGEILKSNEIELKIAKDKKDKELNKACEDSILAGFIYELNGINYWFSYDDKAQGNFRDAKDMLSDGVILNLPWTVRVGGKDGPYDRIQITLDDIKNIAIVVMNHKLGNISRYRDVLMKTVNEATRVEDVQAVIW